MKWLLIVASVLVAIALLIAVIGWMLPVAHVATREGSFTASPDTVWKAITDVDAFPTWRSDVKSVERMPDAAKLTWIERGGSETLTFTVDVSDAPHRLVTRIADPKLPFGGTWTYELSSSSSGTVLRITEHGEIYNPIFRALARFVFGYESTMVSYLDALKKKVG
jgi:uncharacterized protein YndB with AHSA1/START domain